MHEPFGTGNDRVGIGTTKPAGTIHAYNPSGNSMILDHDGSYQVSMNFITLGTGTQGLNTVGTQGWHMVARGNQYADSAAQQNDLLFTYFDDTTADMVMYFDHEGNVGINDATPRSLFTVGATDGFMIDNSGNATSSGWFNIGTTDVIGTLGWLIGAGDLHVGGDATTTGSLHIGSASLRLEDGSIYQSRGDLTLSTASGLVTINDDFTVLGNVTSTVAIWVGSSGTANMLDLTGGDLYVADDVEIDDSVTLGDDMADMHTMYGDMDIAGSLLIDNDTSLPPGVPDDGNLIIYDGWLFVGDDDDGGDTRTEANNDGDLYVENELEVDGNVYFTSNATTSGNTYLGSGSTNFVWLDDGSNDTTAELASSTALVFDAQSNVAAIAADQKIVLQAKGNGLTLYPYFSFDLERNSEALLAAQEDDIFNILGGVFYQRWSSGGNGSI